MNLKNEEVEAVLTENPVKLSMDFTSLGPTDIRVGAILAALTMYSHLVSDSLASLLVASASAVVLFGQTNNCRLYYVPILEWRNLLIRLRKGRIWESEQSFGRLKRVALLLAKVVPRSIRDKLGLMFESYTIPISNVAIRSDEVGEIGIANNLIDNTSSIVLRVRGSTIPSLSLMGQHHVQQMLAEMLIRLSSFIPGYNIELSMVFRRGATTHWTLSPWYGTYANPDVITLPDPSTTPAERYRRLVNLRRIAEEDTALVSVVGGEVTMAMVVTIKRENLLSSAAKGKGLTPRALRKLKIIKLAKKSSRLLQNALGARVEVLDLEGLHGYFRSAWDIATMEEYQTWCNEQLVAGNLIGTQPTCWPQSHIRSYKDGCEIDGSHHTVLRMTTRPPVEKPNDFRGIFGTDAQNMSVAIVAQSSKSKKEYALLNWLLAFNQQLGSVLGKTRSGEKAAQREQEMEDRQKKLHHERFVFKYSIFTSVSNTDRDALDEEVDTLASDADGLGMDTEPVSKECLQLNALLTATTGIRLL
jgi:hypothetical protein